MSRPVPEIRAMAKRLVGWASHGPESPCPLAAAEHLLQALAAQLGLLVGPTGFDLMLKRALKRASAKHPLLRDVRLSNSGGKRLSGIKGAEKEGSSQEIRVAVETVIAELIELIARLLGADMAVNLVRQSLPNAPLGRMKSGGEELQP